MRNPILFSVLVAVVLISGCGSIGPGFVTRDRFDYNTAISESWKEQTLMNIVKLRYADMPLFVEVSSIVSGYTLESTVNIGATSSDTILGDSLSLGGSGKFIDRPTTTYVPITGGKFNKSLMTPIPPGSILFLMQSGWPADLVFPLTIDSINGLRSQMLAGANRRTGNPDYYRVIDLMRTIQRSGAVGMRIKKSENQQDTTVLFIQQKGLTPEIQAARNELVSLLDLNPDWREASVSYGLIPKEDGEIALLTRSMLQIMIKLATSIDVPSEHIAEGRTVPSIASTESEAKSRKLIDIQHSKEPPADAFTAIKYRDYWYWISDRDFRSKRTFAFLMILFSLTETGGKEGLPLVTIPAG